MSMRDSWPRYEKTVDLDAESSHYHPRDKARTPMNYDHLNRHSRYDDTRSQETRSSNTSDLDESGYYQRQEKNTIGRERIYPDTTKVSTRFDDTDFMKPD